MKKKCLVTMLLSLIVVFSFVGSALAASKQYNDEFTNTKDVSCGSIFKPLGEEYIQHKNDFCAKDNSGDYVYFSSHFRNAANQKVSSDYFFRSGSSAYDHKPHLNTSIRLRLINSQHAGNKLVARGWQKTY